MTIDPKTVNELSLARGHRNTFSVREALDPATTLPFGWESHPATEARGRRGLGGFELELRSVNDTEEGWVAVRAGPWIYVVDDVAIKASAEISFLDKARPEEARLIIREYAEGRLLGEAQAHFGARRDKFTAEVFLKPKADSVLRTVLSFKSARAGPIRVRIENISVSTV